MEIKVKLDEKIKKEFRINLVTQLTTLLTAAFGLIAALAWNESAKSWMDQFIKSGKGAIPLTIYAVIVTVVAVALTMFLSWLKDKLSQ